MTTLNCSICARSHTHLSCANCANDTLWTKRYETVTLLAEKEQLEADIQNNLGDRYNKLEGTRAACEQTLLRIAETKELAKKVWEKNEADRAKLATLRQQRDLRQAHLARQTDGLASRRQATLDTVQHDTSKQSGKWNTISQRTQEARSFLCREAAQLYGLRPRRRKVRTTTVVAAANAGTASSPLDMQIGGLPIPTLAELNKTPAAHISTVMAHLSHLLVLASHYLALKLPHEIVLPNRGAPYTTIKTRTNQRPRPLYISADLPVLMRENPSLCSLFLEGYAMLCHNVSFLCFTQGLDIPAVEELMAPGLCLYRILVARASTPDHPLAFGIASHGSALNSLAKVKGQEALRRWTVTLNQILEFVRNVVQGDAVGAEWDLVEVDEKEFSGAKEDESKDRGWTKVKSFKPT